MSRLIAISPAHNEAACIGATVDALKAQTRRPDRIIVVADNCTDDTETVAAAHGAEVLTTVGNTGRKAGALNFALEQILPGLADTDHVFIQDADTVLVPRFLELALKCAAVDRRRVVCGRYAAVKSPNPLVVLQRCRVRPRRPEYRTAGGTHPHPGGHLHPVPRLRAPACDPGPPDGRPAQPGGTCTSRTVSPKISSCRWSLHTLGYVPMSPNGADAVTDAMRTVPALWAQRIRWMPRRDAKTSACTGGPR